MMMHLIREFESVGDSFLNPHFCGLSRISFLYKINAKHLG